MYLNAIRVIGNAKRKENGELNVPPASLNKYINFYLDIQRYHRYFKGDFVGNLNIVLPYSKGYDEHPFWLITKLEYIRNIIQRFSKEKEAASGKK